MSTTARTTAAASAAPSSAVKKAPAAKSAARPATKAPAARAPRTPARTSAKPHGGVENLPVRAGEDPWTVEEINEVEQDLRAEVDRLRADVASADRALDDLLRDAGTGAGDDQADTSSKNFEREHEMSIVNHARDMLVQSERALARIANGTYGECESCGEGVGKARLQVFPRATLCKDCKEKQERR
ncbi:TraR/DksA family transcriptional regulator [Actinospica durhamensis]|uniref:TraR/DksA family transcriptional regulator n=1 Tax=Actinospica durhamensis TaxID=1508375 RepID=A0A941IRT3_9ACTN|nr:TraR/DksA family transcriptional regulator [Actinospica durhamensis]MBR7835647.1 TraR/DksA family transcriptional regulator [Actinospica durhamensis]